MTILKNLLFLIIGLVLICLAIGFVNPSVQYGHEITVNKSVEEAWAVSQDESKYGEWLEGFKSMELISGEKFKEGSKYKIIVDPGEGQPEFEMTETLVSIKEFDHVEMSFDSEMMDFHQIMTFAENDGKTTVKTDSKVIGKSIVTRSMFALMEMFGDAFQTQEAKNIEALKKVIEENTTDYYPEPEVMEEEVEATESDKDSK